MLAQRRTSVVVGGGWAKACSYREDMGRGVCTVLAISNFKYASFIESKGERHSRTPGVVQ